MDDKKKMTAEERWNRYFERNTPELDCGRAAFLREIREAEGAAMEQAQPDQHRYDEESFRGLMAEHAAALAQCEAETSERLARMLDSCGYFESAHRIRALSKPAKPQPVSKAEELPKPPPSDLDLFVLLRRVEALEKFMSGRITISFAQTRQIAREEIANEFDSRQVVFAKIPTSGGIEETP